MNKAVLMSIKPEYCEKIFSGEKTIEVRKSVPKLKTPFKVYVYCTLTGSKEFFVKTLGGDVAKWNKGKWSDKKGYVIGEFICKSIVRWPCYGSQSRNELWYDAGAENLKNACLSMRQLLAYGKGSALHALSISSPRLYSKPKELSRFIRPCPNSLYCESCATFSENRGRCFNAALQITRPPQSWQYVEEWDFHE